MKTTKQLLADFEALYSEELKLVKSYEDQKKTPKNASSEAMARR